MALTRDFRETIRERAQAEQAFRKALLGEAIEILISGDEKTGRAILRNYVNATAGFSDLEQATGLPATGRAIHRRKTCWAFWRICKSRKASRLRRAPGVPDPFLFRCAYGRRDAGIPSRSAYSPTMSAQSDRRASLAQRM